MNPTPRPHETLNDAIAFLTAARTDDVNAYIESTPSDARTLIAGLTGVVDLLLKTLSAHTAIPPDEWFQRVAYAAANYSAKQTPPVAP